MIEILVGVVVIAMFIGAIVVLGKAFTTFPDALLAAALITVVVGAAYILGGGAIAVIAGVKYESPGWAWWLVGGGTGMAMVAQFAREYW